MTRRRASRAAKGGSKARRTAVERHEHERPTREARLCEYARQAAATGFIVFPERIEHGGSD